MRFLCFILLIFGLSVSSSICADIKAVVFDCDGVLVDSDGQKFKAWQTVLEKRGYTFTPEEYKEYSGHTGKYFLEHICEKRNFPFDASIIAEKNEVYRLLQRQEVTPIYPMMKIVELTLKERAEKGLLVGVASSAARKEILYNLQTLGILDRIDVAISGKDLKQYNDPEGTNKPKPYIYQEICSLLNIEPKDCLVFEDTEAGVTAASAAGCQVIAIPTEWSEDQNFEKANYLLDVNKPELMERFTSLLESR